MSYPAGCDAGPGWRYRGIGLSNTIHSDVAPCLPLPSLPVFCGASDPELRLVDEPSTVTRRTRHSSDSSEILSVSSKIADLLRETDVSYLNLRVDTRQTPFGYVEPTTLHEEVVRQNPEAFNYSIPGHTQEQIPSTMHEKKPLESGALEGNSLKTHQAHKELGESRSHHLNHVTTNDIFTSSKKSKVKKRVHDETPSFAGVDPAQHQDDFIGSFCEVLEDVCARAEFSGDDRDELEWLALPISDLRVLVNEIVSIHAKKLLHLVPPNILIRLLRVLGHQIHRAEGLSIDEMDPSDSDTLSSILCALEAIHACLAVISHNQMPKQLYSEEIIERILEFARHQITDIMCIFDPSYRSQHKPNENGAAEGYEDDEHDVDYGSAKKRRSVKSYKMKRSAVNKVSAAANTVLQKLCTILGLLKDLLLIEKLSDSCILQLVRTSFTTLLVDNVQLLQLKAIALTSAIFYSYKQHRTYLVDEMIQLLWKLPSSKRALRTYLLPDEDQRQIQMITALLVQFVHCSANLPEGLGNAPSINAIMEIPLDTDYLTRCHEAVTEACCLFWTRVLERLTSVKAQDASEVKVMMENLVMDLMTTLNLPEYPASALILEVFCVLLLQNAGLKSKDIAGRSMAIDFLGTIAARLKRDAVISKLDKLWMLQELNDEDGKSYPKDVCSVCNDGRLEKLLFTCQSCQRSFHADCLGVKELEGPSESWNCQFCVCRKQLMVLQSCCKTQIKENPKRRSEEKYLDRITNLEIVQQLLLNYLQDSGSVEDIHFFVRWFYLCLWYKDDPKSQQKFFYYLARLRAKSIVRDSSAYSSLTRQSVKKIALALGQYNSFSRGFDKILRVLLASLRENSPGIRAKALRAVSIIVEADPEVLRDKRVQLAVEGRFCDTAISVREAALELVGRHIASHPDVGLQYFEKVAERIKDTGVSVRKRSIKIIKDMCTSTESFAEFTSACIEIIVRVTDDESSVQDLVCKTFYDFWFDKPSRNQTQYYSDGSSVPSEVAKKTEQIVDVLRRLPHHQLLVTVIKRNLALDFLPQSTKAAGIDPASLVSVRKRCELMCKCLLEKILQVDESTGGEKEVRILPYVLVLHAFCVADPTLCAPTCDPLQFVVTLETYLKIQGENRAVAQLLESIIFIIDAVIPLLRKLPQSFVEELEQDLKNMIVQNTFLTVVHACIKCLCSVMKVAGYGSFLVEYLLQVFFKKLESHEVENKQKLGKSLFCLGLLVRYGNTLLCASSNKRVDVANSLSLFRRYLDVEDFNLKVRSLQGLGFVLIARPDFMLDKEVGRILDATLSASTDYRLKIQALQNVYEYLLDAESQMGTENVGGDNAEHHSGEGNQTVPVAAGAGDTNICGGIVQLYWDKILERCIDLNEQVRQTALKIVEVVLRQGLVHPITCVPYLIALETDPQEMNSKLAHHLLMNMNEKYPAFFESRLGDGLQMSFKFIQVLNGGEGPGKMKGKMDGGSLAQARLGVSRIYKLIRGNRVSRNKFMSSIVRKFDNPSRNELVIPFLMYCTEIMALLPFTTPDEPLYMVYAINRIIQVRAGAIEANLKAFCSRWCPREGTQGNGSVQHEGITQINFGAADLNGTISSYGVDPSFRYDGHMGFLDLNGGIPGMDNFEANYTSPFKAEGLPNPMASSEPCEMSSDDLQKIQGVCIGALALQLLLKLKRQLKIVYSLNDARCQAFSPTEPLKPGDPLTRQNIAFNVGDTRMELPLTPQEVVQRYQEFKNALREDTIDYSVYTANIKVKRPAAPRGGGRGSKRAAAAAAAIYDENDNDDDDDDDDDDNDENWRGGGGRVSGSGRRSSYRTRQQRP